MAEKDTVFKQKIKHDGICNFKDFYSFTFDFLNEEGYSLAEKTYSEKIAGDTKEIKIEWEAKKKISDYFKFAIKVDWQVIGLKKIKVKRENKEIETNSGVFELKISGVLIKDYENRWEGAPFWKFMRGIYERYIIKGRIDKYEDKLAGEVDEFVAQCKSFLDLETKK